MEPLPPDAVVLRPMVADDVPAIARLARAQGRNVGEEDYARFATLEGARGFVIERDGQLLGIATVMRYYEHGFLGPVILQEGADSAGLAIALLAQLIEAVQRDGIHVLEAEAGRVEETILARMGFETLRKTAVFERAPSEASGGAGSEPMRDHHLLDVGSLDASAVGFGRKQYLAALMRAHPEGARVLLREGDVAGYVLMRRAPHGFQLGPLVTRDEDADVATSLLRDALATAQGAFVVALAPEQGASAELLERHGFRRVGELARMRGGTREAPGEARDADGAATQWALGGRITG